LLSLPFGDADPLSSVRPVEERPLPFGSASRVT
jgi:hypothetical protein